MPEPHDECHEVTLPSGEVIRVRGSGEMTPDAVAALGVLVDAVRAKAGAEHPPNPGAVALWRRLRAAADARGIRLRDAAHEAGVRPSTVVRIGQGFMPDRDALHAIEGWLTETESGTPTVGAPQPSKGDQ